MTRGKAYCIFVCPKPTKTEGMEDKFAVTNQVQSLNESGVLIMLKEDVNFMDLEKKHVWCKIKSVWNLSFFTFMTCVILRENNRTNIASTY